MTHGNYITYLISRHDLPLSSAPFCEVDALVLSVLSYTEFAGIVPGLREGGSIPLSQAFRQLNDRPGWENMGILLSPHTSELVRLCATGRRFGTARLCAYETKLEEGTQFAALTLLLSDGTVFAAFRGTDDNLVGWKECFELSFTSHIPSQRLALRYLTGVAGMFPGKLRVGGHSKGGNLAVWSAVHAPLSVRRRVLHVYSFDGPGFVYDLTATNAYQHLSVTTLIPQASIVGVLFNQDPKARLIQSTGKGIGGQHDPYHWVIRGNAFPPLPCRDKAGLHSVRGIRNWVASMDKTERKQFTECLFSLLSAKNAQTITDLTVDTMEHLLAALRTYTALPKLQRDNLNRNIFSFIKSMTHPKEETP